MSRVHALLAKRHEKDIYVPECKMGEAGTRVLDAWVLLPTWSPLTTIGYEVKVSRSDWTRDQKFLTYRPVCHLLMVAAEPGVVRQEELPAGVGLLEATGKGDGGRLVMRVKPARVEPDHAALVRLMSHVLMWRTRVQHQNDRTETRADRVEKWRRYLRDEIEWRSIGYSVRGKMRETLSEAIAARVEAERQANLLVEASKILKAMGIESLSQWNIRGQIEHAIESVGGDPLRDVESAIRALGVVREHLASVLEAKS